MKTKKPAKGTTAVAVKETVKGKVTTAITAIASVDPQALLMRAIDKNLPIESMERLLAMRDKMKAEWAREQFFTALAGFQRDCPIIGKNHVATIRSKKGEESSFKYNYAPLESIIAEVQPVLERWGFSWTCKPSQTDGHFRAIVHAHHKDGHEEVTEFEVPLDSDSYMSAPQKAAAASTFARRYAFINAFGITTKGEDNDAQDEEPRRHTPIRELKEVSATGKPLSDGQPIARAVPTQAEVKHDTDYDKAIWSLKASATDPKTKAIVKLFSENEILDYTFQANQAKNKPDEMAVILKDIVDTAKKRTRAVKGDKA